MSDLLRPEPPASWRDRARSAADHLRPGRVLVGVATVVVTAVAATWLLRAPAPPVEASLPAARPLAAAVTPAPATTTTTPEFLVVQAAGAVVRPGVYRLAPGARAADVVQAAGGVTADADPGAVLLAAPVGDGERVYVPRLGEAPPPAVTGSAASDSAAVDGRPEVVNLNTATEVELDQLPGVGPATARAIVAHRDERGPFATVDQLLDVRGIGAAKLEALRPLVTV